MKEMTASYFFDSILYLLNTLAEADVNLKAQVAANMAQIQSSDKTKWIITYKLRMVRNHITCP